MKKAAFYILSLSLSAAIPDRVHDLLGKMTVEEKVAQLQSQWTLPSLGAATPSVFEKDHLNEALAQKMLGSGLGTFAFLDEFMGMSPGGPREGAERRNLLQNWVLKNTRLGIPIMFHGEALHGAATKGGTQFPQAVGLGSTWDPDLLREMFTTVAQEVRASGNPLFLAPVLDLAEIRDMGAWRRCTPRRGSGTWPSGRQAPT